MVWKIAETIGVVPVVAIVVSFNRVVVSGAAVADQRDEEFERRSAGDQVPEVYPPSKLSWK